MSLAELRNLVTDHQACTPQEITNLRDYHSQHSHVRHIVVPLINGGAPVQKAVVKGLARIGCLKTFFGNVGHAYCRTLFRQDRHRISQVPEVLRNANYNMHPHIADMATKLNQYKYKFALPNSDPKVTIVDSQNEVLIADGNKTAIAAYIYALETANAAFKLAVYYIKVPTQVVNWPL
jgi:hypothetical protein